MRVGVRHILATMTLAFSLPPMTAVVALSLLGTLPATSSGTRKLAIAVVESRTAAAHQSALEGFRQSLGERQHDAQLSFYNTSDINDNKSVAEIRSADLILTLGTVATKLVKDKVQDVPIVFADVLDPLGSGLVESMASPGGNLTGVALDIPIRMQFEVLQSILTRVQAIGIVYDPRENGGVIAEASKVAADMGLTLVAKPVTSERDVPETIRSLSGEIDALWMVADKTVFSPKSRDFIILFTLRNKIPFMGISAQFVQAGALVALYCDYIDIGRQSGDLALKILAGADPADLPITVPRRTGLAINLRVAERIGLNVSPQVMDGAEIVFR